MILRIVPSSWDAEPVTGGRIRGMDYLRVAVGDAEYLAASAGDGPPVLLLHGFPQTHYCWRGVVAALAERHTVVVADIRGYGETAAPPGGPRGEGYSKREMGADLFELMAQLGHSRFSLVGHDRGARVAYRMALDRPERIERLAVLNVVPTVDQFERMGAGVSLGYWPWVLFAQPAPFPERLLSRSPELILRFAFESWAGRPDAIGAEAFAAYADVLDDAAAASMCADYRASFWLDQAHDAADRAAGRRIGCPVLVLAGAAETQLADAGEVWSGWAHDVRAATVPGGHFIPEEAPGELAAALLEFLG
jgi:haloacetate dehalogenase